MVALFEKDFKDQEVAEVVNADVQLKGIFKYLIDKSAAIDKGYYEESLIYGFINFCLKLKAYDPEVCNKLYEINIPYNNNLAEYWCNALGFVKGTKSNFLVNLIFKENFNVRSDMYISDIRVCLDMNDLKILSVLNKFIDKDAFTNVLMKDLNIINYWWDFLDPGSRTVFAERLLLLFKNKPSRKCFCTKFMLSLGNILKQASMIPPWEGIKKRRIRNKKIRSMRTNVIIDHPCAKIEIPVKDNIICDSSIREEIITANIKENKEVVFMQEKTKDPVGELCKELSHIESGTIVHLGKLTKEVQAWTGNMISSKEPSVICTEPVTSVNVQIDKNTYANWDSFCKSLCGMDPALASEKLFQFALEKKLDFVTWLANNSK